MKMYRQFCIKSYLVIPILLVVCLLPACLYAHDSINVHPFIAEQAFNLWPDDTSHEISTYLGPGYRDSGSDCNSAKQGDKITEGAKEEDDYDPIADICVNDLSSGLYGYYHHFYNPDIPGDNNGLFDQSGALYYAKLYWQRALDNYDNVSTRGTAYWYLGRIAHLLGDSSVPAHVLRDTHVPVIEPDSYEDHVKTNYTNWNSQQAKNLGDLPDYATLDELFYNLAQRTQYFPSDDFDGNTSNTSDDWFTGWPNPSGWRKCNLFGLNCYIENANLNTIGGKLMPLAIQYTAVLYKIFWKQVHPNEADFTGSPASGATPLTVSFLNLSTYDATSWAWDFGDGSASSEINPMHTYTTPGYYNVSLHATGTGGTVTKTKNNYVNVGACANGHIKIGDVISNITIQQAHNSLSNGDTMQAHAYVFSEDLLLQNDTSVTLKGGFNCDYSSNTGFTTVSGSLTIKAGTVTIENLIIK
jgi:PKD repeat protein